MRRLSLWMRAHPMVGDSLIALGLLFVDLLVLIVATVANDPTMPAWYVAVPVGVIGVLPLVWRRAHPLYTSYAVLITSLPPILLELGIAGPVAVLIGVYTVLVYSGRRHGLIYAVAALVIALVQTTLQYPGQWEIYTALTVVSAGFCWVLGEFVGARHAYRRELEARLHLLETEQDQSARIAVAEERSRISRELHDVVAHAVSVMVVQADGASYAIGGNTELAREAVRTISSTGREALTELRRLLDVLRGNDDTEPRVPQPGADGVVDLAERVRAAGLRLNVELDESLSELPAGVSLGVYRIVQESLTNALKHAGNGARAEVEIRREEDTVRVEIRDDGAGRFRPLATNATGVRGGNGLIGMRERASVFGGTLEAGPSPGGGWRVRATLPVRSDG